MGPRLTFSWREMMMHSINCLLKVTHAALFCLTITVTGRAEDEIAEEQNQGKDTTAQESRAKSVSDKETPPSATSQVAQAPETQEVGTPSPNGSSVPPRQNLATESRAPSQAEAFPYDNLQRLPRKLRPIEGQTPPPGYVEVDRRKKGLIIGGSVLFGSVYLACVIASVADRMLLIPLVGPMIAGYSDRDSRGDDLYDISEEEKYTGRLFGTLGTLAQVTGLTLFIFGMAQKSKIWLRQDIAGLKIQVTPTLVGFGDPGIGLSGTF